MDHNVATGVLDPLPLHCVGRLVIESGESGLGAPVVADGEDAPRVAAVGKYDVLLGDEGAHGRRTGTVFAVGHLGNLSELLVEAQEAGQDARLDLLSE